MRPFEIAVLTAVALAACDTHPATQVVVYLHAPPELRDLAARVQVRVEGAEGEVAYEGEEELASGAGAIARVPIVPRGGDATRTFRIEAALLDAAGGPLVELEASSGYVEDELR